MQISRSKPEPMNLTERIEAKIKDIKFLKGAPLRDMRIVFALILFTTFAAVFSWVLLDAVLAERMGSKGANSTIRAVSRFGGQEFVGNIIDIVANVFSAIFELIGLLWGLLQRILGL